MGWIVETQAASPMRALAAFYENQFAVADALRRAQGEALGAFGLDPVESRFDVIASGAYWRLRDYGGRDAALSLLIVAAPIKRPYIWDLDPSTSAVRYCRARGFHVYLLEWKPASALTGHNGVDEHIRAIFDCVERISARSPASKPFLIGHSLGGTLAAIGAATAPESIRALALFSAPLCFEAGTSPFRDALVSLLPTAPNEAECLPGSLLSHLAATASPGAFLWARLADAVSCMADPRAMETYARVERWALDEVAVSGKLFREIVAWLYRENRLCRGSLQVGARRIGPRKLSIPVLAVVNAADDVAPLSSIRPFFDALPTRDSKIFVSPPETGVCLQHVGVLVGRTSRERIWPEAISWLRAHG